MAEHNPKTAQRKGHIFWFIRAPPWHMSANKGANHER
jgi:hypothetical protein